MQLTTPMAKDYRRSLFISVGLQMFFQVLGGITFDGGLLFLRVNYSMAIYWVMALLVILRRPSKPTKGDLIAIRYGFLFILAGIVCVNALRSAIMGLSP